jgi:hypothetical protein
MSTWRYLIGRAEEAARLRARLGSPGGYPPSLRSLHEANARELELLVDEDGWPVPAETGEAGCAAALAVAMDALSRPALMRRCLGRLKALAARGEAPAAAAEQLERRIRAMEGRGAPDADLPFPPQDLDAVARELGWRE